MQGLDARVCDARIRCDGWVERASSVGDFHASTWLRAHVRPMDERHVFQPPNACVRLTPLRGPSAKRRAKTPQRFHCAAPARGAHGGVAPCEPVAALPARHLTARSIEASCTRAGARTGLDANRHAAPPRHRRRWRGPPLRRAAQPLRRSRASRRFTLPSSLSSTTQPRQEGVPHRQGMAESAGHP